MKNAILTGIALLLSLSACQKDAQQTHDQFTLRNQGADMPVWVEGNPDSKILLVFLHGGPGGDGQIYNSYLTGCSDALEKEYRVVYWDQRGSGNSAGHFNPSDLTVATFIDDLDKLVNLLHSQYGDDQGIVLLGHSWGGTLGTGYLLDPARQAKIKAWIEVDGAHNFLGMPEIIRAFDQIGSEQIQAQQFADQWTQYIQYCQGIDSLNPSDEAISTVNQFGFEAENWLTQSGDIFQESGSTAPFKHNFIGSFSSTTAKLNSSQTNFALFEELKQTDYTDELGAIQIPSLFLWGQYDLVVPLELGQQAYSRCGALRKEMHVFEHSGHSPMINEMESFVQQVSTWINSL